MLVAQLRIDTAGLHSEYVLESNRKSYKAELKVKIESFNKLHLSKSTEKSWISLFREIELVLFKNENVDTLVKRAVKYLPEAGWKFQRAAVEAVSTLTPGLYTNDIFDLMKRTRNEQLFGSAAVYLMNTELPNIRDSILTCLNKNFPDYISNDILQFLYYDLTYNTGEVNKIPDLMNLLNHHFRYNKTIIYSLHRMDRRYPGITIIKKPGGSFVRNPDSSIFYVKQLAYSTSGFPGYLSQGNTPQGIYSVVGSYVSPTESIGPTANIITRIPFEVSTDIFFHGQSRSETWHLDDYISLLPDSWNDYLPMQEAFFAGKTGRRLIVMHGSTDDLSFYKNEIYFPLTPSKGCLTTKEIWDEKTGECLESDQVKLMNAFYSTENLKGFLVVVNIDDKKKPVSIEEILPYIKKTEH